MNGERRQSVWLRWLSMAWLPVLLLGIIATADVALSQFSFGTSKSGVVAFGALDWCGHLATALLVLLATFGARFLAAHRVFTVSALVGAIAIDLDHIALYAGVPGIAVAGGRPITHSLLTVAVLGSIWLLSAGRWTVFGGLAVGVTLHFVRDIATGSGLALWWPLSSHLDMVSYTLYAVAMAAVAAVAVVRSLITRRDQPADAEAPSIQDREPALPD